MYIYAKINLYIFYLYVLACLGWCMLVCLFFLNLLNDKTAKPTYMTQGMGFFEIKKSWKSVIRTTISLKFSWFFDILKILLLKWVHSYIMINFLKYIKITIIDGLNPPMLGIKPCPSLSKTLNASLISSSSSASWISLNNTVILSSSRSASPWTI